MIVAEERCLVLIDQELFLQIIRDFEEKLDRRLTKDEIELLYTVLQTNK